jgi:hypothetical protein
VLTVLCCLVICISNYPRHLPIPQWSWRKLRYYHRRDFRFRLLLNEKLTLYFFNRERKVSARRLHQHLWLSRKKSQRKLWTRSLRKKLATLELVFKLLKFVSVTCRHIMFSQVRTFSQRGIWAVSLDGQSMSVCNVNVLFLFRGWRCPLQSTSSVKHWIVRQVNFGTKLLLWGWLWCAFNVLGLFGQWCTVWHYALQCSLLSI